VGVISSEELVLVGVISTEVLFTTHMGVIVGVIVGVIADITTFISSSSSSISREVRQLLIQTIFSPL
jgi:hypothetical protein